MRVKLLIATTAALVITAGSATASKAPLATLIAETQVATWTCQDQRGVPRTRASTTPWKLPKSTKYRKWVLERWQHRLKTCKRKLHAHDNVIRRLQQGLSGTPMDGSAGVLEAAARKYGVSPYFIAAIAGTESSFGAAACRSNQYNAFGLSSCGSGWRVPDFQSWSEAYLFMGRFLTERWPNARSTYDYHGYAANSDSWGHKCAFWMRTKFGVDNSVRYPN